MAASSVDAAAGTRRLRDRRAQLAGIAAELFAERGYHSVGLADIASVAGLTAPAIYRHFRSKSAILAYSAQEFAGALGDCVLSAINAEGTAAERLAAAMDGVIELVVTRRGLVRLYQWESRHLAATERTELRRRLRQLVDAVSTLLAEVRPDLSERAARLLATAALSAIASLSTHRLTVGNRIAQRTLRAAADGVLGADLSQIPGEAGSPSVEDGDGSRPDLLLNAAVRLFRANGYHDVSMEDIGGAAGINGSSVYRHFAGKAELLAACYYRATKRLADATERALGSAADPAAALDAMISAYLRLTFAQRDLIAVYLSEYENLPAADRTALRRTQREHIDLWVRLVAETGADATRQVLRLRVHAALNLAHDVALGNADLGRPEELRVLMLAVLSSAPRSG